jgi:pimeloyl-ACP methyl ester carboxylesterase
MLSSSTPDTTIFCLHYLGGSAREWSSVASALAQTDPAMHMMPVDLPGFGDSSLTPGFSVQSMATFVADLIRATRPQRWMLVGHSMGAKVATVVASWQPGGTLAVDGLTGLVLLAGSPPSPEPMSDHKRASMSSWFLGDEEKSRTEATGYIADNVGAPLDASSEEIALEAALACNRSAWLAWLQLGSREDWAARIGLLTVPCVIVTGSKDEGLGLEAQRKHMAPHFSNLKMVELPGAGHLLPLERPQAVAELIAGLAASNAGTQAHDEKDPLQRYRDLIMSDRVAEGTRRALLDRISWHPSDAAKVLNSAQEDVLACVLDRVIPQHGFRIDLAGRLLEQLASGQGDGWRFDALPEDCIAYPSGLDTLERAALESAGKSFVDLDQTQQDHLLKRAANGTLAVASYDSAAPLMTAEQIKKWFEDVRGNATRLYVSHPDTLARLGYSGIANGGDGQPKSGFIRIGLGETESWEPKSPQAPS